MTDRGRPSLLVCVPSQVQDARLLRDDDLLKKALQEYDLMQEK